MADAPLSQKLRDVDSFNRPTVAKVGVVVAIPVAAVVAATAASALSLEYSAQAGVTMLLTALLLVGAFVGLTALDSAVWGE